MPQIRRVGDFNHAYLWILNCFSKRLPSELNGWGENGLEGVKGCLAQLQDCYKEVIVEASRVLTVAGSPPARKRKEPLT